MSGGYTYVRWVYVCPVGICPVGICPGVFVLESFYLCNKITSLTVNVMLLLLLLITRPLPRDGAWQNIMEPQKPGNFQGPGTEIVERQRVAKE